MVQDYRQPRSYELMTVLIPDLDEEQTNAQVDRVQQIVAASGEIAANLQSSPWGRRRLAYTIRHNGVDYRDGYYLLTYFTAMPDKTADLERELKLDAQVMRYLLVQSEPYEAPEVEATEEPEGAAETAAGQAATAASAATNEPTALAPQRTEGTEAQPAEERVEPQPAGTEPAGEQDGGATEPAAPEASEATEQAAPEPEETAEAVVGATTDEATEEA